MAEELTGISAKKAIGHHYNQIINFLERPTVNPAMTLFDKLSEITK
jgi:hypothetical protein